MTNLSPENFIHRLMAEGARQAGLPGKREMTEVDRAGWTPDRIVIESADNYYLSPEDYTMLGIPRTMPLTAIHFGADFPSPDLLMGVGEALTAYAKSKGHLFKFFTTYFYEARDGEEQAVESESIGATGTVEQITELLSGIPEKLDLSHLVQPVVTSLIVGNTFNAASPHIVAAIDAQAPPFETLLAAVKATIAKTPDVADPPNLIHEFVINGLKEAGFVGQVHLKKLEQHGWDAKKITIEKPDGYHLSRQERSEKGLSARASVTAIHLEPKIFPPGVSEGLCDAFTHYAESTGSALRFFPTSFVVNGRGSKSEHLAFESIAATGSRREVMALLSDLAQDPAAITLPSMIAKQVQGIHTIDAEMKAHFIRMKEHNPRQILEDLAKITGSRSPLLDTNLEDPDPEPPTDIRTRRGPGR